MTLLPDAVLSESEHAQIDLIALDEALDRLASLEPRQSQIVELRFFADLSVAETAEVLQVSERTAKSDWQMARAWLSRELADSRSEESSP